MASQHVRSPTTRVAKTAERLHADRRWLVRYVSVPLSACERAVYEFVESAVAGCALARTEAGV
ncbi:hypothetical protein T492DRAFT_868776 [Pavlovales sp. CCMP2436]|nr:hypothetical protein T492DRAFT_868776 [Pavlovales sp. CCMP2436]